MNRRIVITAAILGIVAVVFGAFGAHGLKDKISAADLENWKTAVSYQFYHTAAMLFLARYALENKAMANRAFVCFALGIVLFSGSLYILATRSLTGVSTSILGPVTPIGGVFLILGWAFLLAGAIKQQDVRV